LRHSKQTFKGKNNMDLELYIYEKILSIVQDWNAESMYAISFFVYQNEAFEYKGVSNFPEFHVGYWTKEDYYYPFPERWGDVTSRNPESEFYVIMPEGQDDFGKKNTSGSYEGAEFLLNWYRENGITNDEIAREDESKMYDENSTYIGEGPPGFRALLTAITNVARRLQLEGIIPNKFGKIPIIIHDFEYPWYIEEAIKNANPNGEADVFLAALSTGFSE